MTDDEGRSRIDTTAPHSARIRNYWLAGKDSYPVDRQVGEQTIAVLPEIAEIARAPRQFLARVVRYLAAEAGIRQFLDVGTGLPTVNNTHEVAPGQGQISLAGNGRSYHAQQPVARDGGAAVPVRRVPRRRVPRLFARRMTITSRFIVFGPVRAGESVAVTGRVPHESSAASPNRRGG